MVNEEKHMPQNEHHQVIWNRNQCVHSIPSHDSIYYDNFDWKKMLLEAIEHFTHVKSISPWEIKALNINRISDKLQVAKFMSSSAAKQRVAEAMNQKREIMSQIILHEDEDGITTSSFKISKKTDENGRYHVTRLNISNYPQDEFERAAMRQKATDDLNDLYAIFRKMNAQQQP